METLAFILNLIGLGSIILSTFVPGGRMKAILLLCALGNLLVAISYLLSGTGINGAASCFLGAAQTVTNFFFHLKSKSVPKWLIGIYLLSFIAVNLWVGGFSGYTLLAVAACTSFILAILQENGTRYRLLSLLNAAIWSTYDILTTSYNGLITHATLFTLTLVSFILLDVIRKAKKTGSASA